MKALVQAALLSIALLSTSTAYAQARGFVAVPESAPAKANVMTRATLWKCSGATCAATKSDDRPAVLCRLAVKEMGPLTSFAAAGVPFDPTALAECNAAAR
jgi:hypothetical protein